MPTIAEVKQQIPEIASLSDDDAVDVLQRVYYPDLPKERVAGALGVKLAAPPAPKVSQLGAGFRRSFAELPGLAEGVGAFAADSLGATETRDKLLSAAKASNDQVAQDHAQDAASITDAWDGKTPWGDFLANAAGYTAGQALQSIMTGGVGSIGMRMLAKSGAREAAEAAAAKAIAAGATEEEATAAAAKLAQEALAKAGMRGAAAGAGAHNFGMELGSIYPDAVDQAQKDGQGELSAGDLARVAGASALAAGVDTGAEAVTAMKLLRGGEGATLKARLLREVPLGIAREGGTEAVQTAIEHAGANQPIADEAGLKDIIDSAGVGMVGGAMGGAGASLHAHAPTPGDAIRAQEVPEIGPLSRATNRGIQTEANVADAQAAVTPTAPQPTQEQAAALLAHANQRYAELQDKEQGQEGVAAPQFLTPQEKQERDFLKKSGGDAAALASAYGLPPTPDSTGPAEQALATNPPAVAAPSAPVVAPTPAVAPPALPAPKLTGEQSIARIERDAQRADQTDAAVRRAGEPASTAPPAPAATVFAEPPAIDPTKQPRAFEPDRSSPGAIFEAIDELNQRDDQTRKLYAPILNPKGEPFKTKMAANIVAKGTKGEVVPVEGGWAVHPGRPEWEAFDKSTGTLGVPRADMPQIKGVHRGPFMNYLAARGIAHQDETVDPRTLKPTQAEFSPQKVIDAVNRGDDRSVLVSADGHVIDGHHQWLTKLAGRQPVNIIRIDAPAHAVLHLAREFPSSTTAKGATQPHAGVNEKAIEAAQAAPAEGQPPAEGAGAAGQPAAQQPAGARPAAVEPAGVKPEADLYQQAVDVVRATGRASISNVQKHLRIGYNRANGLIERMVKEGIVGPAKADGTPGPVLEQKATKEAAPAPKPAASKGIATAVEQFGRAARAAGLELDGGGFDARSWNANVGDKGEIHAEMFDARSPATYTIRALHNGEQVESLATVKLDDVGPTIERMRADLLAQEKPAAAPKPTVSTNKIFTDEAADKARALLRSKIAQLNSGIDPEILQAGITLAGWHIEHGARTFAAYAKAMIDDLGEGVKPYLKSWYMGVKYDPRAAAFEGMSTAAEVESASLDEKAAEAPAAPAPAPEPAAALPAPKIVEHTTASSGKVLRGVVRTDLTKEQAKEIDPYTFSKNGGWFIRERHLDELNAKYPEQAPAAAPAPAAPTATEPEKKPTLDSYLASKIAAGDMPKDNPALKRLVELFDSQEPTPARMKEAQEALETAIVRTARDVVAKKEGDRSTFDILQRIYDSQPNLNVRTSTSVENQAYSTPAPLAFLASRLAGITKKTTVLEPTAGTGMLLIGADPAKVTANELNADRVAALKSQGFEPTQRDATQGFPGVSVDRVIANPPFGPIKNAVGDSIKVKVDGYTLGQIDHVIAAEALKAMKDDGRATLIIGANKADKGRSNNDLIFLNWLYSHYNVVSHFEADGDLYTRQGAGWPVRVITIDGRKATPEGHAPSVDSITRAKTWSDVYEQFEQGVGAQRAAGVGGDGAVSARPGAAKDDRPAVPVAADRQAGRDDSGQPEGGEGRPADVAGERPGAVGDRRAVPPQRVGERAGAVGSNDQVPGPVEVGRAPGSSGGTKPASDPGVARVKAQAEPSSDLDNQFQVAYRARSSRKDEGVLIPVNMAQPLQDALNKLEDRVGDIDEFARTELGYDSVDAMHKALMGLQVDSVASAIDQIKAGKAIIIADQTGIGKGRQAASVIRWAIKQGKIPVFVTVKPSLFTDMFGDLHDIGSDDVAPFVVNVDESIKGAADEKLFANKPGPHKATLQRMAETGQLPVGRNAVFMTYSQINVANKQREAVMALAPNAVFILDESHNAGGDSATGDFIKGALDGASGVVYLSATYAKRPDNMPVYFKTDIGEAVADDETLMTAMSMGGLPLQTVVANNLVKAGQMFRRERSYEGVSIVTRADTAHRDEHVKLSDETTSALRAIVSADRLFHEVYVKELQKQLKESGMRALDVAGNQAQESVDHTQFSSVVHNFVRQMLLGLKAQEAADEAVRSIKRGEKPLIAVENTMGSFLSEYAENNALKVGDPLGAFDYRTVLTRALARSRFIVHQLPTGEKVKEEVTMRQLAQVAPGVFEAYVKAQRVIDGLKLTIPVSPIDWMRQEIAKAGHSVMEITGRDLSVDYSDPSKPVLSQLDRLEKKDKVRTTRMFNDGSLDAIILNVAGSTGISLHASERFKDQRQRHMVVGQAAQDINIFMQMLGRIHRTGQVKLPKYTILNADLPAEVRPTALLSKKMKSLNANTSSNTESATSVKAADMLNKYGDLVVGQYLADNPVLADALGITPPSGEDNEGAEDIARRATGRLALMPVAAQEQFYAEVEEQYQALIDYLNKTGQNDLEPRTFDFDAKETKSAALFEGQNPESPFGEDAIYNEFSVKAQGKPMTPTEIRAAKAENLDGKTPTAQRTEITDRLAAAFDAWIKGVPEGQQDAAKRTRMATFQFMVTHEIGQMFRIDINGDTYNSIVTNLRSTHKAAGNPFALSKVQVTLAVNGALRSVTVPGTQFAKIEVSDLGSYDRNIDGYFKVGIADERETAKIVTGNLLGAYGELEGVRGSIISFTKADGTTEQGILLPKAFNFAKDVRQDYRLRTGADVVTFLHGSQNENIDKFGVNSRDSVVRVLPYGSQGVTIQVPKSKARGGKYFLDKGLREQVGDFVSVGNFMRASVLERDKAEAAVDLLMKKQALYALPSMAKEARDLVGDTSVEGEAPAMSRRTDERPGAPGRRRADQINDLVSKITASWAKKPEIVIVRDMSDERIPEAVRKEDDKQKSQDAEGDVRAFYHAGTVYLVANALHGDVDVLEALMHESLGHFGLRSVFGKELTTILDRLSILNAAQVRAKAREYGLDFDKQTDRRAAAEEVLAEMAQKTPTIGWVKRAVAAIRSWLREHVPGFGSMRMTDDEIIRNYILPARAFVKGGAGPDDGPGGGVAMSRGQSPVTSSPAFKEWFGQSKIINDDGSPMVMYHGSHADIDVFDRMRSAWRGQSIDMIGSWFSDKPGAEGAGKYAPNGAIYPVYLRVEKPKYYESFGELLDAMHRAEGRDPAAQNPKGRGSPEGLREQLKEQGHDGIAIAPTNVAELTRELEEANDAVRRAKNEEYAAPKGERSIYTAKRERLQGTADRLRKEIGVYGDSTEFDGQHVVIAFEPGQIKSAIGNAGTFDGSNPDVRFSRSVGATLATPGRSIRDVQLPAGYLVGDLLNREGALSWWHKTVGTPYNLAQKSGPFRRVYDSVQRFLNDVSFYAAEAADLAPRILPRLDGIRDLGKTPLSAKDRDAIARPIFEGTLSWMRDDRGRPVKVADHEDATGAMDVHEKAQELLRRKLIDPAVLRMWQGRPIDEYEQMIEGKWQREVMRPGIVFSPSELKELFGLDAQQVSLYQEFRKSIDRSINNLAISDMLRFGGKDVAAVRDRVANMTDAKLASELLRDHLFEAAEATPDRADVLNDTANKMVEKGDRAASLIEQGYAPLSRFGQYTLDVVDAEGQRVYFGMFESPAERSKMARQMEANYPGATIRQGTTSEEEYKLFAGVSPETLALFGEFLGLEQQGDAAMHQAFQEYIKLAKSNRSSMKRLIERKGIAGFNEDVGRVLSGFVYSNARQTSSNMHMGEMTQATSDIPQGSGQLKDAAVRLVDYVKNPQQEAQGLRGLLFAQYLGGSVASAMVNATQPVAVTFPYLSQWLGAAGSAKMMAGAVKDALHKTTGDARLDAALKRAEEEGVVSPQEVHSLQAQAAGRAQLKSGDGTLKGDAYAAASNAASKAMLAWGQVFSVPEQFNRRVTFIAAYRTAVEKKIADPAVFAAKAVAETQFTYNKGNKPQWARGAVGSVLFTFKQYSVSYLELLHRMYNSGPEGKKAALLALAVLFLMSGTDGLPGADDLDDLIDGLMQRLGYNWNTKMQKRAFFASILGDGGAQFVSKGISGLPGAPIDVSGRMSMGNLIPGTGLLTRKPDHTSDVTELLGPAGDLAKRGFQSADALTRGELGAAATGLLPTALQNAAKAYDMATTGAYHDQNGRKVLDADGYDAAAKAIGFQPNDVARVQEAAGEAARYKGLAQLRTGEIEAKWAQGIATGDQSLVDEARAARDAWNEKNPEARMKLNMPAILRQVRAMRESKAERIEKSAPSGMKQHIRQTMEEAS